VKEGYEAATVTMRDGTVVTGFKQTETAEAIAVRDLATGAVKSIPKSETKAIQSGGTVMPDGLTAGMDERRVGALGEVLDGVGGGVIGSWVTSHGWESAASPHREDSRPIREHSR
jgi:hypothetical protein